MAVYDLRGLGPDFVVHYGGDDEQIDAFTFGNSLISLSNALLAINKEVNPSFSIEIDVTALGGGSFRPHIRAKAKRLSGLLLGDFRQGIVGALAAIMLTRWLGLDSEPKVQINVDHVEIRYENGDSILLSKDIYDAYRKARDHPDVDRSIRQTFEILEEDEEVRSFGLSRRPDEPREDMPFQLDRDRFADVARPRAHLADGQRERIVEQASLQIVRAIFEDSARRWQFVWRGNRISAPVLDRDFRRKILNREVSITHGDVFIADVRILQTADTSGIWINDAYEILKVHDHKKAAEQSSLLEPM